MRYLINLKIFFATIFVCALLIGCKVWTTKTGHKVNLFPVEEPKTTAASKIKLPVFINSLPADTTTIQSIKNYYQVNAGMLDTINNKLTILTGMQARRNPTVDSILKVLLANSDYTNKLISVLKDQNKDIQQLQADITRKNKVINTYVYQYNKLQTVLILVSALVIAFSAGVLWVTTNKISKHTRNA